MEIKKQKRRKQFAFLNGGLCALIQLYLSLRQGQGNLHRLGSSINYEVPCSQKEKSTENFIFPHHFGTCRPLYHPTPEGPGGALREPEEGHLIEAEKNEGEQVRSI